MGEMRRAEQGEERLRHEINKGNFGGGVSVGLSGDSVGTQWGPTPPHSLP